MQPQDNNSKPGFGGWTQPNGGRPNVMGIGLIVLYLIVLPISLWAVYSSQNSKLEDAEKAAAQAQKAISEESANIDQNKYQAVFLDSGQVYFGKIKDLNSQYLTITNIYYLNTDGDLNTLRDDGQVSLIRLGCELHGPADKMVINRSSITFWENIREDGQVAKAIDQHIKTTNDERKCE